MNARYWTPGMDRMIVAKATNDTDISLQLGRSVRAIRLRRWRVTSGRIASARPTGRPVNQPEDVWRYVAVGAPDECWPWQGATRRRGYGIFSVNHKNYVASRIVYEITTGMPPGSLFVCHRCDNPPCCNPAHLFLGTATDNVRDMLAKGRARPPRGKSHHWSRA